MEPVIRKLTIQGFRSFRSEVVEFDNPTFLVGCNGSGKSNLVDALAFLSEAMTTRLTEVFSRRGGGRVVCHGSSTLIEWGGPSHIGARSRPGGSSITRSPRHVTLSGSA